MTMLIDRLKAARRVSAPLIAIETADAAATIKLVVEGLNGGTAAVVWDVANGMLALNDEGQDAMQKVDAPQTEMSEFGCVRQAEAIKEDGILLRTGTESSGNRHRRSSRSGICVTSSRQIIER